MCQNAWRVIRSATTRREQIIRLPLEQDLHARPLQELLQPLHRFLAERDQAFAIALAEDAQHALVQVDRRELEVDELRHAQTRCVQDLEHRAIAVTERVTHGRSGQQGLDFLLRERPWQ
jgi:hypothetical protein